MKKSFVFKKVCALLVAASVFVTMPTFNASAAVTSAGNIARGIDVSRYQGTINWAQVAASGIKFAFLRVGNTVGGKDPTFEYNIQQAQANGIQVGVYLYSYAKSVEEAAVEAQLTLAWLGEHGLQLPVVYDVEDKCHTNMSTVDLFNMINTYCTIIDAAGFYPMVYTYKNFYHGKLGTSPWDKWMAQYGDSLNTTETVAFWQYSSSGSVPGISGRVDMDYQYKDYSKLIINEGFVDHAGATRFYRGWRMQTGWIDYDNNKYLADVLGNIQKGWFPDGTGSTYYFDATTGAMQTGVVELMDYKFYFSPETGKQSFGFIDYGAGNRYFDPLMNGAMSTSWFAYEGKMHYADKDGNQAIGLTTIDKDQYFFAEDGALVTNDTVKIYTKTYIADETGKLTEVPEAKDGAQAITDINGFDVRYIDMATGLYHDPKTGEVFNPFTGAKMQ